MRSLRSSWQYVSVGSDNDLELSRRQAIFWFGDDPVHQPVARTQEDQELNVRTIDVLQQDSAISRQGVRNGDTTVLR